ncbi:AN1-type zinc finger protein 4-like [Panonychus citri]|uniref:AN1-type zinc finger protein 4-like n=1 Tax=Panonychus citri TaxID=50023 RepID=UPI0023079297|nr:AN1-type zinc finger protein 4-like [Panonychus citri]
MWYMNGHRSVQQIPIYVETFSGTTFEIQILPQETIYCLKMKLQEDEGIQASQQHLIWQGEELKDDLTLEEYGIGFGAILRLVLQLRGGPLNPPIQLSSSNPDNQSDNLFHYSNNILTRSSTDDDEDSGCPIVGQDDGNSQLTNGIVIFQDGNEIKMYSPGKQRRSQVTTGTDDRSSIGSADPLGMITTESLIDKARASEQRQRENDALRVKMREIQTKMKSLALKRCKNLPGTNLIKLPLIVDNNSHGLPPLTSSTLTTAPKLITNGLDGDTIKTPGLTFPPLLTKSTTTTTTISSSSSSSLSSLSSSFKCPVTLSPLVKNWDLPVEQQEKQELRRAQSKLIEQLTRKNYQSKRFSGNMIRRRFSIQGINFNHHETINSSGLSSSSPPSALVVKLDDNDDDDQRPKTSPFIKLNEDNCSTLLVNQSNCSQLSSQPLINGQSKINNTLEDNNDYQQLSTSLIDQSTNQSADQLKSMSRKGSTNNLTISKIDQSKSEPNQGKFRKESQLTNKTKSKTLPPVGKSKSKTINGKSKNRCFTCNKRLGLATKYDCRCGQMFCTVHRYSEAHDCSHDYKSEGRRLIALNNPVIKAPKLPKI